MGCGGSKDSVDINPAFEALLKHHTDNNDIVSVGSGYGVTEKKLEDTFDSKIVTIDPFEGDFGGEEFGKPKDMKLAKMPMYSTVEDYLSDKKKSRDNTQGVSLIIDWPDPNSKDEGISDYDTDSIKKLEPSVILIRYASCGASGSSQLHSFLKSCKCPYTWQIDSFTEIQHEVDGKYEKVYSEQTIVGSGDGLSGMTVDVVVLVKKNL